MSINWYDESRTAIQAIYEQDWQLFCGLLADTSSHNSLASNVTLARRAYADYIRQYRLF